MQGKGDKKWNIDYIIVNKGGSGNKEFIYS